MWDNELKNNINSAFEAIVPDGQFEKITAKISVSEERTQINMTKRKNKSIFLLPAAACLLFALVFGLIYQESKIDSLILIDINPSIEMSLNKNEKVVDVEGVNEDAKAILSNLDLKKTDIDEAINEIVSAVSEGGYLDGENNGILVTVINDDTSKADNLRKTVVDDIANALTQNETSAQVVNQTVVVTDEVRKFANDNYISYGKAVFIMKLAEKDSTLNTVDLVKMGITELSVLVEEKNIDISDFCDVSENLYENIHDAIVDIQDSVIQDNELLSNTVVKSKDDAKLAALTHAKLKTGDVKNLSAEIYKVGNRNVYWVGFEYDGVTYNYDIDAETGEIISCGTDELDGAEGEYCGDEG